MQTLHDIVSSDPVLAKIVAEEVLEEIYNDTGVRYEYNIKTWRERIQRWLVNGRYAKKIMEGSMGLALFASC